MTGGPLDRMLDAVSERTTYGYTYGPIVGTVAAMPDDPMTLNLRVAVHRIGQELLDGKPLSATCSVTEAISEASDLREFRPRQYAGVRSLIESLGSLRATLTKETR